MKTDSEYFANINKIMNFFRYTTGSGMLFCACSNEALIQEINRQIIEKGKIEGRQIARVYLTSEQAADFLAPIREAAQRHPGGVIVDNLNELVRTNHEFVQQMNFAREILIDLDVPLMFWLSEENLSVFANEAADLFSRKDRGVVHFKNVTGVTALDRFQDEPMSVFRQTEDFKTLQLKIELLEKQLREAEHKGYSPKRIADDIAADLMRLYLNAHLRQEAWELFERYGRHLEERTEHIELIADLHDKNGKWGKALDYYLKSEQIKKDVGDRAG